MQNFRDQLIIWFIKNHTSLYESMFSTNHYPDSTNISPYHAEGTVWTHTMMVMTYIQFVYENQFSENDFKILLATGLLHDTGKPDAKTEEVVDGKTTKYRFKMHEGYSTFRSIGILKSLKKDFPEYTDSMIKDIIQLVSLHGVRVEGETDRMKVLRTAFNMSDKMGAVRISEENIQDQYSCRNFLKQSVTKNDKELVLLVGLPCSGKSTYLASNYADYFIVSRDKALYDYCNEWPDATYNEVYSFIHSNENELKKFEAFFEYIIKEASNKDKVIVDMTMLSLKSRRNMMSKFSNFTKYCKVIMTDNETMFKRNNERKGKFIPYNVYNNMMASFTMPVIEEGFKSIELIIN